MPASKTASVSLEPPYAFPFVRVVPVAFYAGTPPEPKDTESPGEDERDPDKDKHANKDRHAKDKRAPVGNKSKATPRAKPSQP